MEADYKFLSEVTKACLPFGVSNLSEVKREEISNILKSMDDAAKKTNWIYMFFYCRVRSEIGWDEESVLYKLKELRSDVNSLKGKLKE